MGQEPNGPKAPEKCCGEDRDSVGRGRRRADDEQALPRRQAHRVAPRRPLRPSRSAVFSRPSLGPRSRYAVASFAGQLGFALLFFAASVLAARLLGPAGKGEYTAWTLASVVVALALAGSIPVGLGRAYLGSERVA